MANVLFVMRRPVTQASALIVIVPARIMIQLQPNTGSVRSAIPGLLTRMKIPSKAPAASAMVLSSITKIPWHQSMTTVPAMLVILRMSSMARTAIRVEEVSTFSTAPLAARVTVREAPTVRRATKVNTPSPRSVTLWCQSPRGARPTMCRLSRILICRIF